MIMTSSNFIFNFTNFCVVVTKLLTFGILFSTAVRAVDVANTAWKLSVFGVILVCILPHSD